MATGTGHPGRKARKRAPSSGVNSARPARKANKVQISLTVSPELLTKIDDKAGRMGQSRAAVIGLAMYHFLGGDEE